MHPELKAHPDYFRKEIVRLADNVYMAFGFAASNVYMIIGKDSLVIIDTTEPPRQRRIFWPNFARSPICRWRRSS
jgi:alkyl sulfatase BDS1-like metallo-beta-lactamase superfamily hydrolase